MKLQRGAWIGKAQQRLLHRSGEQEIDEISSQRISNAVGGRLSKDVVLCSNWLSDECTLINAKDIILIHRNCAIRGKPLGSLLFPREAELFHVGSARFLKEVGEKSMKRKLNCYLVYFDAIC